MPGVTVKKYKSGNCEVRLEDVRIIKVTKVGWCRPRRKKKTQQLNTDTPEDVGYQIPVPGGGFIRKSSQHKSYYIPEVRQADSDDDDAPMALEKIKPKKVQDNRMICLEAESSEDSAYESVGSDKGNDAAEDEPSDKDDEPEKAPPPEAKRKKRPLTPPDSDGSDSEEEPTSKRRRPETHKGQELIELC